jgi:hypothetical protein
MLQEPAMCEVWVGLYTDAQQSIQNPLREGHHFDQALGGVAGLFENMRANTQVRYSVERSGPYS